MLVHPGRDAADAGGFEPSHPSGSASLGSVTDVPPFPECEGGLVLSATISRYAYGALAPRNDTKIGLESVDFGPSLTYDSEDVLTFDGRLDLAKAAIEKLGRGGYDVFLHSKTLRAWGSVRHRP
jgi:hypothetical protein